MRILTVILLFGLLISFIPGEERRIPAADVKTIDGKNANTSSISNNGRPIIICFFATWCKPCKKELDAVSENYVDWQKETGVKVVAISIDDPKTVNKVPGFVKANDYDFEVYVDHNMDFKRAMNVTCSPHTFLVDNNGNIVWEDPSYTEGEEEKIFELVKKLAKGEKIEKN
jgi:cytochrome c biogenesis protein CcmG, thiol:disulfide interchange protein DsbE